MAVHCMKAALLEFDVSVTTLPPKDETYHEFADTLLATNVDFMGWTDYVGDPPRAMALLDRG